MIQNWEELFMPDGCVAICRGLTRLEKWANENLVKFNNGKCQVLHLRRNNHINQYVLETKNLESSFAE